MIRLLIEMLAGLIKLFQGQSASFERSNERNIGATMQREMDLQNEENRVRAAGHADFDRLPTGPDPLDRDGPV